MSKKTLSGHITAHLLYTCLIEGDETQQQAKDKLALAFEDFCKLNGIHTIATHRAGGIVTPGVVVDRLAGTKDLIPSQAWFSFDEAATEDDFYKAWTWNETWNGWGMPYFEKDEADRFLRRWNANITDEGIGLKPACYDADKDEYVFFMEHDNDNLEDADCTPGEFKDVGDKHVMLYPIGAGAWTWNQDSDKSLKKILDKMETSNDDA